MKQLLNVFGCNDGYLFVLHGRNQISHHQVHRCVALVRLERAVFKVKLQRFAHNIVGVFSVICGDGQENVLHMVEESRVRSKQAIDCLQAEFNKTRRRQGSGCTWFATICSRCTSSDIASFLLCVHMMP